MSVAGTNKERMLLTKLNELVREERTDQWVHFTELVKTANALAAEQDLGGSQLPSFRTGQPERVAEWLAREGFGVDGSAVTAVTGLEEGNGLAAAKDIADGDVVLSIPRAAMLRSDHFKGQPVGNEFLISSMPTLALTLALIVETRNRDSKWRPYILSLPSTFNTLLYFSLDDCLELSGSPALSVLIRDYFDAVKQYFVLRRIIESHRVSMPKGSYPLTWSLCKWAMSAVQSRQNNIPMAGGKFGRALIPLWDLANHRDTGAITTDYDVEKEMCVCRANAAFKKGEQFYMYYGARPQHELLLYSGFVADSPRQPSVTIYLAVGKEDNFNARVALLNGRFKMSIPAELSLTSPVRGSPDLLRFVRVLTLNAEELTQATADETWDGTTPRSDEAEARARSFLRTRIELLLQNYPTTAEKDEELLQTARGIAAQCIRLRLLEKRTMAKAIAELA